MRSQFTRPTPQLQFEKWKPAPGFEGWYSISDHGRVRRDRGGKGAVPGRILKPCINTLGYALAGLHKDRVRHPRLAHRLVLMAFLGAPLPGQETNHKNGNKLDNRLCNLEWVTSKENKAHAYATGLKTRWKLTREQVAEARASQETHAALDRRFGVSRGVVARSRRRAYR